LHVVQELWDLFQSDDDSSLSPGSSNGSSEQLFLAISKAALSGSTAPRTVKFNGSIQHKQVTMLLDSGSSSSFISTSLAAQLCGVQPLAKPVTVQVAGGGLLSCEAFLPQALWFIDDIDFQSDLRILPLAAYGIILGMDWLESFSPMKVHWKQKWLELPYGSQTIRLQGVVPEFPEEVLVQLCIISPDGALSTEVALLPIEVQVFLDQFSVLFKEPDSLPPSRACNHENPLIPGARPVNIKPYRYPPTLKTEIERQVAEMLDKGIIQPSTSLFSSPVLLVKKKDGSYRFCVDFRHLNALTLKSKFLVPVFDQLMDELGKASWFSKLDLLSGFHQILLKPGEEFKTAFQTHFGQYEFRVLAFELVGALGTFQVAMNVTLAPGLRKFVIVFFDDILVYSASYEEHLKHLHLVFESLNRDKWKLKRSKCTFAQRSMSYLGHIISGQSVATDPIKVQVIVDRPVPALVKELRSFLGLAGYYRKFVKHFGIIARPLTDLLKKNMMFVWTTKHDTAFATLKKAMSSAPVLSIPDFSQPFAIETDASATGVGAVLLQNGHPLAFISKSLGPKNKGLSTYEKEYLAILVAVDQWRHYLQIGEFTIFTDQCSLIHLNEQRLHTFWQQKVFTKLLGLDYKIVYKQGSENRVADTLSRMSSSEQVLAISSARPQWLEAVVSSYSSDPQVAELVTRLTLQGDSVPNFTLHNGVLRFKNRIWISSNHALRLQIMEAMHSSALGGHLGVPVTYSRLKLYFFWTGMKSDVKAFV
jgi:hypothetical protein